MAYFNHAYPKVFLGTQTSGSGAGQNPNPNLTDGFITTAGIQSVALSQTSSTAANNYGPGSYGFFVQDPAQGLISIDKTYFSTHNCCPITLASASLLTKDKLNQYIGGYKESNKSKLINPRFTQKVYRVDACTPQQAVISIGYTPTTAGSTDPNEYQGGTTAANCCYNFLCGETYYLRIDIKGSPALRFLNHNAYQTLSAYTGCCTGPTPTAVDPTLVYIEWAKALVINNYLKDLAAPVVYDYTGTPWYAPGTTVTYDGTNTPVNPSQWWDQYPASMQAAGWSGQCTAGLRLFGAYIETKFGNCTFQVTDFFEKEPVRLYASLVDYNGDPCVFEGLCVYNDCRGHQGMGFGEQVVRDLILSESYLQNHFASNDFRIREITQGYDILNSVDRNALYVRYYILHNVPRYNNPSGTFDNDRYLLEIISTATNTALETFLNDWLNNCPNCVALETETCTYCNIVPDGALMLSKGKAKTVTPAPASAPAATPGK